MTTPQDALPFGHDRTAYARSLGYELDKAVVVQDGRVVSHRGVDWAEFCTQCRTGRHRKPSNSITC